MMVTINMVNSLNSLEVLVEYLGDKRRIATTCMLSMLSGCMVERCYLV